MIKKLRDVKVSLKVKLTSFIAVILIGVTVMLTFIAIKNAKTTYGDQLILNFGDDLSITMNDKEMVLDGDDDLNDILSFVFKLGNNDKKSESTFFNEANKQFTKESIIIMVILIFISIIITYRVVKQALRPIKELDDSIKRTHQNNLNTPVKISTNCKEINSLQVTFNRMLERLNSSFEMQKNFASNSAHELKTPLATMKASIQVLEMEEEPTIEEYKENIEVMKKSVDRLIDIVENLLGFTKDEDISLNDTIVIKEILEIVVDELKVVAENKNISIKIKEENSLIKGNATLIYRVLFNLVENAIKYNKENGEIFINSILINDKVTISIQDTGYGMDKEELDKIFEPFYRVDKSRSREMGGSGLGLSIVKKIIEKHNGELMVNSIPNIGTSFILKFNKI